MRLKCRLSLSTQFSIIVNFPKFSITRQASIDSYLIQWCKSDVPCRNRFDTLKKLSYLWRPIVVWTWTERKSFENTTLSVKLSKSHCKFSGIVELQYWYCRKRLGIERVSVTIVTLIASPWSGLSHNWAYGIRRQTLFKQSINQSITKGCGKILTGDRLP